MKTMAAELNATFSLYKRKDGIWGSLKNGSWSGMLQNLVNGNADMIVSGIVRTKSRSEATSFLPTPIQIPSDRAGIFIKAFEEDVSWKVWQYRLWSFQGRDTKLERFLAKKQL